jgi:hypothetical protein
LICAAQQGNRLKLAESSQINASANRLKARKRPSRGYIESDTMIPDGFPKVGKFVPDLGIQPPLKGLTMIAHLDSEMSEMFS